VKTISAIYVHLLSYQLLHLIENYINPLWSFTVVSILVSEWKLYQQFVFIYRRINSYIWLETISVICGHLGAYQFLYLSENCFSNLCSFTAVWILVSDWKLYQLFVVIYCRINSCIWVKTVSAICVHLLPYQFLYLIENISAICVHLRSYQFLHLIENNIRLLWSFTVYINSCIWVKTVSAIVFIYSRINYCIWLETISAICGSLRSYQLLYLIENCISNLCSFTVVSILVSEWKLYQKFVFIYCLINSSTWLKTISAFCGHLLSYQLLHLIENCISHLW
jgi:hypothetical protein